MGQFKSGALKIQSNLVQISVFLRKKFLLFRINITGVEICQKVFSDGQYDRKSWFMHGRAFDLGNFLRWGFEVGGPNAFSLSWLLSRLGGGGDVSGGSGSGGGGSGGGFGSPLI